MSDRVVITIIPAPEGSDIPTVIVEVQDAEGDSLGISTYWPDEVVLADHRPQIPSRIHICPEPARRPWWRP